MAADRSAGGAPSRRMILLGPPNSGKGTQAKILAERMEVPHISTGDMLREARDAGTELGKRVDRILAAGELVDDETMADLMEERLSRADARRGFLLDGYPRTLRQVRDLERILGATEIDTVLLIDVPEEVLVQRGLGRGREDDTEDVIRRRIEIYREQTEPLVQHYGNIGVLETVDGNRSIEAVSSGLLDTLGLVERGLA